MRSFALAALVASIASTAVALQPRQTGGSEPERFTAFAISLGGPRTQSGTEQVEIVIKRWSTEAERQRLLDTLEQGQDAVLEVLRDLRPVGTISTPGRVAYDLHYAHQAPGEDGGRRIFLATDRPIGFWEAANRPRSINYPFTFIELRVNDDGEGEGKLALATRLVASSKRFVQLENYAAEPVRLTQVKRQD